MSKLRVAVVGAGVVGANIAHRLAARGAEVMVFDAATPGDGTSWSSISWLSSFPQIANSTPAMVAYRQRTDERFRALESELEAGWLHWTGTLTWGSGAGGRRLARDYLAMRDLGAALRTVTPDEVAGLDPAVVVPADATVYLEEGGGWVDAPRFTQALLRAASAHGAVVHANSPVVGLARESAEWRVATPTDTYAADVVVIAAGIWTSQLAALAHAPVPLDLRPGLVVYSTPLTRPLRRVLNAPEINLRPDPSGGVAIHWRGEDTYTGHGYNAADPQAVLDLAAEVLPEAGARPARVSVGIRPVPPGGPIVGWHPSAPRLFIAVSHGGVGWGPHWAEIATAAVLDSREDPRWSVFAPERFFRATTRATASGTAAGQVPAQM